MPTTEQLGDLYQLANFMDDLPHPRFHIGPWSSPDATDNSCGTAGCVGGWTATLFNKRGWRFEKEDWVGIARQPYFGNHAGFAAFEAFFGITEQETRDLCLHIGSKYYGHLAEVTTQIAAAAIRDVAAKYGPDPRLINNERMEVCQPLLS